MFLHELSSDMVPSPMAQPGCFSGCADNVCLHLIIAGGAPLSRGVKMWP